MKDIFTDLYNKVLGFFRQTEKKEEESAKDVACNRLKFVIMQDRTNLTPELMDRMRNELIELLSKYVEMDKHALELGFEQEGTQMALMLSIPVVRAKDEAEIEAILAKEDEEKAKREADAVASEAESAETEAETSAEEVEEIVSEDENQIAEESSESGSQKEEEDVIDEIEPKVVAAAIKEVNKDSVSVSAAATATAPVTSKTATATVERKAVKASVK